MTAPTPSSSPAATPETPQKFPIPPLRRQIEEALGRTLPPQPPGVKTPGSLEDNPFVDFQNEMDEIAREKKIRAEFDLLQENPGCLPTLFKAHGLTRSRENFLRVRLDPSRDPTLSAQIDLQLSDITLPRTKS